MIRVIKGQTLIAAKETLTTPHRPGDDPYAAGESLAHFMDRAEAALTASRQHRGLAGLADWFAQLQGQGWHHRITVVHQQGAPVYTLRFPDDDGTDRYLVYHQGLSQLFLLDRTGGLWRLTRSSVSHYHPEGSWVYTRVPEFGQHTAHEILLDYLAEQYAVLLSRARVNGGSVS